MLGLDSTTAAWLLLIAGAALAGFLYLTLRKAGSGKRRQLTDLPRIPFAENGFDDGSGVLIVGGGRVEYANRVLINWLNLPETSLPNLEHLARRTEPSEIFLELCSTPGRGSFALQGRMMQATSQVIPYRDGAATIVTFRPPEFKILSAGKSQDTTALDIIGQLSATMTTHRDLPSTVQGILESVESLVAADIAEITCWRESENSLAPFVLSGLPGSDRALERLQIRYKPGQGLSGTIFQSGQPLLITGGEEAVRENGMESEKSYPFRSFIGIPLLIGEQPVGTLELATLTAETYDEEDLRTLLLVANQAAIALQHAVTREEEERRVAELTGLANLAEAANTILEGKDLFEHLVSSIRPLLVVEVLGFLMFDENTHRLQAQAPFVGIVDHFVPLFGSQIEPGSPAEQVWLAHETIIAPDATNDPRLDALDLTHLAHATGIQSSVLTPLVVAGRSLGYLLAANKQDRTPFTGDEIRILAIVAGQTAAILENAALLNEARRRTRQAEALRRIAALASSAATLDEILLFSLNEVARLVGAVKGGIFLIDQDRYAWAPHRESLFGVEQELVEKLPHFKVEDPLFARTVTSTLEARRFSLGSAELEGEPVYQKLMETLGLASLFSVPLIVSDRCVGEVFLSSSEEGRFGLGDIELASTAAGQIAGAIERILRSRQSDETLRQRVNLLTTISRIGREFNTSENLDQLLELIHTEALSASTADCGRTLIFDPGSDPAEDPRVLAAAGDDAAERHGLTELESNAVGRKAEMLVEDFDAAGITAPHDGIRSALLVPITHQDRRYGLLNLHTHTPSGFTPEAREIAGALATQAGIALANLHRLREQSRLARRRDADYRALVRKQGSELGERSDRQLEGFMALVQALYSSESREGVFETLASGISAAMGFNVSLVAVPSQNGARLETSHGEIPDEVNPEALLGQRNPLRHTLHTGKALFVAGMQDSGSGAWRTSPLLQQLDAESFVCLPILSREPGSEPEAAWLGIRRAPVGNYEDERALLNLVCEQAAHALHNIDLREQTGEQLREVDLLLNFSRQLGSLQPGEILRSLQTTALEAVIPAQAGMVLLWDEEKKRLRPFSVTGYSSNDGMMQVSFKPGADLPGRVFAEGRPLLVDEINLAEDYNLPFEELVRYQEATRGRVPIAGLAVPIPSSTDNLGVLVLDNFSRPAAFDVEDERLIGSLARQTGLILENARLLEEARQRAVQLETLAGVARTITSDLQVERISATLLDHLSRVIPSDTGVFWFRQEDVLRVRAARGFKDDEERIGLTVSVEDSQLLKDMVLVGQPINVANVREDPRFMAPQAFERLSWLGIPLIAKGEVVGVIALEKEEPGYYTAEHLEVARTFAAQAAVAVQNASLFSQTKRMAEALERRVRERTQELEVEHERTETLLGIITELSASLDMDIVLNRTLALINRILGAEQSSIILANPADASALQRASRGYASPPSSDIDGPSQEVYDRLAADVIASRTSALIPDLKQAKGWSALVEAGHRSAMAIPLMLGAEALGAMMLFHSSPGQFTENQLELIQTAAQQIAVAVNNAHLYLLIRDQAERLGSMLRSQQVEASRLRAILEAVVDGVLVTNDQGEISIFNLSAERILELPAAKVTGRSLDHFIGLFGKAGHSWMQTIRSWSEQPGSYTEAATFSEEIKLDNDRVVAVNLAPVYSPQEFLGTVSIFRDITHVIEVDRLKSEFVATVSHELRTPMTSIKGYVDILLMGAAGPLSDQQEHFLNVVQSNTERLNILVNDLLEVSRIEAGKITLAMARIDIQALVSEVVTEFRLRSQEEQKEMSFKIDTGTAPSAVRGDPERVRQILDNLVGNAYSYTPPGGKIEVSFHADGDFVRVAIKDNGVGISPEDQGRIFERFYRGDAPLVASVGGTGLGLSIVKYLVDLHGGEIWIESRGVPGDGSTFIFTLPAFLEDQPMEF